MKKITPVLLALILVFTLILSACQSKQPVVTDATGNDAQKATLAPVKASDRVVSEGAVIPAQYASISFQATGTVNEVLAGEGQTVKAGDLIARLKGSDRLEAAVSAAELQLLSAQQALDTLNRNADVAKATAQYKLAQAAKDLDKAKEDREKKDYVRASQSNIDQARASLILAEDGLKQAEDMWTGFEGKDEADINRAAALMVLSKARYEKDRAQANLNYAESRPDPLDVDLAQGKLVSAQAVYDQAQRDWAKVKDGPDPDQLALTESQLDNAKAQLKAAKAALADLTLTAPFAGTIVSNDLKVGQQALGSQGNPPILLADLANYQVKTTDLTELNVVNIKIGTPVKVTFDAIPELELTGKVLRIKALGEDKQGDVTYTVYVDLDQQDPRLLWNMTASVIFETGQ